MSSFRELQLIYEDRVGDTYSDNTNRSYTPRSSSISYDSGGLRGIKSDQYAANSPSYAPVGEQEEEVNIKPALQGVYDKVVSLMKEAENHDMQYAINQLADLKQFIIAS